jgi:hypothetical protein
MNEERQKQDIVAARTSIVDYISVNNIKMNGIC